jgi:periplasmic divalent cation tolerance protein
MKKYVVIFVTAAGEEEALGMARSLVGKKLAACCSLVRGVRSVYRWDAAVEESEEVLMMIKTSRDAFPALEAELRRLHSYATPEIIALPVVAGSAPYLKWIDASVI